MIRKPWPPRQFLQASRRGSKIPEAGQQRKPSPERLATCMDVPVAAGHVDNEGVFQRVASLFRDTPHRVQYSSSKDDLVRGELDRFVRLFRRAILQWISPHAPITLQRPRACAARVDKSRCSRTPPAHSPSVGVTPQKKEKKEEERLPATMSPPVKELLSVAGHTSISRTLAASKQKRCRQGIHAHTHARIHTHTLSQPSSSTTPPRMQNVTRKPALFAKQTHQIRQHPLSYTFVATQ